MPISLRKIALLLTLAFLMPSAFADPFGLSQGKPLQLVEFNGVSENKFLPGKPRARVGEKRAASQAKHAFPNSKILSVNYMQGDGSYRVKLLSRGGVVKYVFVDPNNGEVFE